MLIIIIELIPNQKNKTGMYDSKGYFDINKTDNKSREVPSSEEYNFDDSTSSDDIPLANITANITADITEKKIKPSSTPTLSALSISVPSDKSNNSSAIKSKKLNTKPLIDLSSETSNVDFLKKSPIVEEKKERKVSIKVPKRKKKKQLFSYCCSSKVLDNSYVEDGSRSYNKDLYIKCQKEQIHSFEAKRMNSAKNKNNYSSSPSNSILSSIQNDSIEDKKEKNRVSFQPNYLSRRSSDSSNLSGVSSVSSSSSTSENEASSSSTFESVINDNSMKEVNNYLKSDINDKSPQKTIVVPSNQTNTQYIHSKKEKILDEMSSPISNPASPKSNNSTVSSSGQSSPIPGRRKQEIKYCTSYELCDDGNWRLVERRYNDSKVIKVEIISSKMI